MSNGSWSYQEESKLADFLVERVCDRASGRNEGECIQNLPRDVFFIGNLRPRQDEQELPEAQAGYRNELMIKLAPVAFGAEFLLQPVSESVEIEISINWACYYRVFPSLVQQRKHQRHTPQTGNGESATNPIIDEATQSHNEAVDSVGTQRQEYDADIIEQETEDGRAIADSPEVAYSADDRRHTRVRRDTLFIRFRKISCNAAGRLILRRDGQSTWTADTVHLQAALDGETERAETIALNDPEHVRTSGDPGDQIRVPDSALASEATYRQFQQSLQNELPSKWKWSIDSEVLHTGALPPQELLLAVEFVNSSPMDLHSHNLEPYLFDTKAAFRFAGHEVRAFELDLAPHGFRYDKHVWGRGINCAVEGFFGGSPTPLFATTHAPVYHQMRFEARTSPSAKFAELSRDPMPVLDSILHAMDEYQGVWLTERQRYIAGNPDWEAAYGVEFDLDSRRFADEIERFRQGCELIRLSADVRLSFQLTNETFRRGTKDEWRLFQIVFLVSQIPGIAALADPSNPAVADRDQVDIVYFPTGGGKTEAYLATIVFHCFFDRLRGKSAGITAWTRFPLRLLTLQQTQRVADIIGLAELVRREQHEPRLSGTAANGFAVGYFVGEGGSPNEILNPQSYPYADAEDQVTWSKVNDAVARQDLKRVVRCPSCHTRTVSVEFDPATTRLMHRCSQPDCSFPQGIIPVYIVDNEIFRYLPSVIVGTIDKLAGLGNQRKFSLLFGQVDGRCSVHGYYNGRCCQKDCRDAALLDQTAPEGISGPTLFIQDELHLLKEGLGTFDSHYETFVQRLQRAYGQIQPIKIIASSATIEAFERQVNHLYGKLPSQARIFPGPGPTLGQSFYAATLGDPQRLYVGVIPHNKTIFNTILELIEYYHYEIQRLQRISAGSPNPYGGTLMPGTREWQSLLDLYATSLTYFLSNRELNSIRTDLEGDVIPHLQKQNLLPLEIAELTGSTSTDEVSRILEKLERVASPNSPPDAVLATSMVSHGVDVDRFNAMIFYGMPRQNAEYIQASSRVGRSHPGVVFACFHPVRERDQSHYSFFAKFHDFLGQLVEPVAINRWSKYSINRTLPGLFMAVLLQVVATHSGLPNPNRYYFLDFVRGKLCDGSLLPEHFIPFLEQAYGVDAPTTVGERVFQAEIRLRVRQYLDWILSPAPGLKYVSEILIPKPMRSLRDVDEAIPIELDSLGTNWVNTGGN